MTKHSGILGRYSIFAKCGLSNIYKHDAASYFLFHAKDGYGWENPHWVIGDKNSTLLSRATLCLDAWNALNQTVPKHGWWSNEDGAGWKFDHNIEVDITKSKTALDTAYLFNIIIYLIYSIDIWS